MMLATTVAVALILAQGAAVWAFLRFVTSFGAYTKSNESLTAALLTTHESNLLLHQANLRVLAALKQAQPLAKEVA